MAGPLFAELQNADSCQSLLMEVKVIGRSAINQFCLTNSRLQKIAGPGTACQVKWNTRGKKGPVRIVFTGVLTGVLSLIRPRLKQGFLLIFLKP